MQIKESVQSLMDLGFTGLEATIYIFLLTDSPATGYRVAKAIGKPAANTYKALETMEQKGAILFDEGARRLCRAVPYEELLTNLERAFMAHKSQAMANLSALQVPTHDDRIYRIRSLDQVMERCRSMLDRAQQIAIMDIFPTPLTELLPDLKACASRGVDLTVKVYSPADIPGARVIQDYMSETILARWPGQWANLVIDATEHLLAFIDADGKEVLQAVWSGSPYLSSNYHGGIHAEITLDEIGAVLDRGGSLEEVREAFAQFRRLEMLDSPGYEALLKTYGIEMDQAPEK